ncbi:hypothetical protein B0T25DRAFT_524831 [Lasiosphaeria hispida]|uniref:Uncharacterized protein n=1 Tax=Lasiosphaeria hispida TaxID=260671 RepID=A0AAJ0MJB8_9PEZI|nr:hypothetical protein B0T25DRAFT_524831 [Lasiosphaeria hispida]
MNIHLKLTGFLPRTHGAIPTRGRIAISPASFGAIRGFVIFKPSTTTSPAMRQRSGTRWQVVLGEQTGIFPSRAASSATEKPGSSSSSASSGKTAPDTKPGTSANPALVRAARLAFPERLVIYHAGTGKTTFLACLKLTTIFVFVFFGLIVTPSYLAAGEPAHKTAAVALCAVVPFIYVAYTTTPFVTAIHLNLPTFARTSAEMLKRFAANVPPTTRLDIQSMSLIGKPRTSSTTVADLRPSNKRFGMVNYERDTKVLNKVRKWWRFRAVGKFNVQKGNEGNVKMGWVWKEISKSIAMKAEKKQ